MALSFVVVAVALRWAFSEVLGPTPFFVFYLALVGAAAFGGLGPGLLATIASWLCIDFLFDPTPGHIGLDESMSIARLLIFLAGALVVSLVGERMRRSRIREHRQTAELAAANAALQRNLAVLAKSQEIGHLGNWSLDFATGEFEASDEDYRIYGFEPQSLVLLDHIWPMIHPEDLERYREYVAGVRQEGRLGGIDYRIVWSDGSIHYVHALTDSVVRGSDGRVQRASGITQDITERKHAEEALAESRRKYRGLVEKINDWVWEIDTRGVYTYVSPRALELLGYLPEEIVGKTPFDFMPPGEAQRVWNAFQPIWQARKPLELFENTLVRKDGGLVTVETSGMPVFAEDGSFRGYTGVDRDVTARKCAEEALRESEERYRRIVETATEAIVVVDAEGRIVFVNDRWSEIVGYTGEEAVRMTVFEVVFPDDMALTQKRWASRKQGRKERYEVRLRHKDGNPVWALISMTPQFGPAGEFLGELIMAIDITQRVQAEEALRRLNSSLAEEVRAQVAQLQDRETHLQEEVFRRTSVEDELHERSRMLEAFFQHTLTPLAFLDRDFNYVRINQAYARMAGRDPEYFVGKNYFTLCPGSEDRPIFEAVVRTRQPHHAYARLSRLSAGPHARPRYWNWLLTPLLDARGQVQSLVLNLEDVTERQTAFEELKQRARQLQKLTLELTEAEERERQRLAELLHDDLQQVLAAAKFQVSLLSSRVQQDARFAEIAGQAKELLTEAIAKSRTLSHEISAPALAQGDLGEAFEWLIEQMQVKHGFTVHLEVGNRIEVASEPLRILLYKAAQELLFNAIKYAGVHEATLRLRRRRGRLWLLVSDQGRGFDPTASGAVLGFGLLSIRERVGLLGGRLKIRSAAGKGSTFAISVPDSDA